MGRAFRAGAPLSCPNPGTCPCGFGRSVRAAQKHDRIRKLRDQGVGVERANDGAERDRRSVLNRQVGGFLEAGVGIGRINEPDRPLVREACPSESRQCACEPGCPKGCLPGRAQCECGSYRRSRHRASASERPSRRKRGTACPKRRQVQALAAERKPPAGRSRCGWNRKRCSASAWRVRLRSCR